MTSPDPFFRLENLQRIIQRQMFVYNVIGAVLLPVNALTFYLIIFQSKSMREYRYYILYVQLTSFVFDAYIVLFMKPVPYMPIFAGTTHGVLASYGFRGHTQMTLLIVTMANIGSGVTCCFFFRHQIIAGIRKKRALGRLGYRWGLLGCHFWLVGTLPYNFVGTPEAERLPLLIKNYPFAVNLTHFNYDIYEESTFSPLRLSMDFNFCVIVTCCTTIILMVIDTVYQLHDPSIQVSQRTKKQQLSFLISLIFQISIPIAIELLPLSYMNICFYLQLDAMRESSMMAAWMTSTHSICTAVVVIALTPVYRRQIQIAVQNLLVGLRVDVQATVVVTEASVSVKSSRATFSKTTYGKTISRVNV